MCSTDSNNTCIYRYLQAVLQSEPSHLKLADIVCVDQDRMMEVADNVPQHYFMLDY